ncbi:DUF4132 domain-containing protein [Neolewinella lacunae]|uniref:DUF4132 domain-containing protein n=1 Tax=Neolewinella lacunae TaxID=1517758 RepID=A0A923PH98_9BACT|nr:DUF4132 domain-containing protein [Neolewinella lacunae]MBC6994103.1 DUF4132 domain-containing protein [Neolewinella lacunae]MDN3636748.1 DUF4132 domain-containing protein [Neolewinella lacunae]
MIKQLLPFFAPKTSPAPAAAPNAPDFARTVAAIQETTAPKDFDFNPLLDAFGLPMNLLIKEHDVEPGLQALLRHAATASAARPSATWRKKARALGTAFGVEASTAFLQDFLLLLHAIKPTTPAEYTATEYRDYLIHKNHQPVVKGLLWLCSQQDREDFAHHLGGIALVAYKKVPGQGPLDLAIGNACTAALALMEGHHGIGQLASLSYRVKQSSIRKKIERLLDESAGTRNLSRQEIEDISVRDYGLRGDVLESSIGEYTAVLRLEKPGKVALTWRKADKTQKSVPQSVRAHFAGDLTRLKATKKALESDSSSLRDRLDWSLRLNRSLPMAYFLETWLGKDLLRYFADRLIWQFSDGGAETAVSAIRGPEGWENAAGEPVEVNDKSVVRMWHPALATTTEVEAWRAYCIARQLTQPLKQAFREVYLLTLAEENTRTYSNRMAAHLLKQHQFAQLARGRGWTYSLIGAFDHGMATQPCYQELQEVGIRAEYLIQELDNRDGFNQMGIWNVVGTDQVRFFNLNNGREVLELVRVPPIVLSEVLRDTDLFVGVASIGNDEQWADGGGERFQTYWRSYSTDALTELGANRKLALERLLPRLKIRNVATLDDKYLRVRGKIRHYKIHIGSGNILMEPNDQYLCIVPGPTGARATPGEGLYLPFEGDRTLSIILSKALLLADDDKIKDVTITRQLKRW